MSVPERVERLCAAGLPERTLRVEVLSILRSAVSFDAYAWLLSDPETAVGASPLADVPALDDLPDLIRLKYGTVPNRWTSLTAGSAATLVEATAGRRWESPMWVELLSGYGVDDVLSSVSADRHGCWAFLDLWRCGASFTSVERDLVALVTGLLPAALRRGLADTFIPGPPLAGGAAAEPAVLVLSDRLRPIGQTPQAEATLRALLPADGDRAPIPAAALNVAAQLLAAEAGVDGNAASARVHVPERRWVTLRAARLGNTASDGPAIAVSIEPTPPAERLDLYARVIGLSRRETELLRELATGCSTRELAGRLYLSEHTVQDHLKAIFAKAGVSGRRVLTARATGSA